MALHTPTYILVQDAQDARMVCHGIVKIASAWVVVTGILLLTLVLLCSPNDE